MNGKGQTSDSVEHRPSISIGDARVKPQYLQFIRAKESGAVPVGTTWQQYRTAKGKP
jgi:hypothetical protein